MPYVYLLQHVRVGPEGDEDVKTIGIYRSQEAAEVAIARVAGQPGFRDAPDLADPDSDDDRGFHIDRYDLDEDHWTEGFISWAEASEDIPTAEAEPANEP